MPVSIRVSIRVYYRFLFSLAPFPFLTSSSNNSGKWIIHQSQWVMASSPATFVCTACHMYSLFLSVGDEGFMCNKCREIVRLTERILELETRIQTLIEDSKKVRALDTALDASSSGSPVHCSVLVTEPPQQGDWVTVRRHICPVCCL